MLYIISGFNDRVLYIAAIVALCVSACHPKMEPFPEGVYVMEIEKLKLRDRIRLHSDLSWERKLTYTDDAGAMRDLFEKGKATLVQKEPRVLKFEPFTYVFESLLPIEMTALRKPSKTMNTTMGLRREKDWVLDLNSEFGYEYHRTNDDFVMEEDKLYRPGISSNPPEDEEWVGDERLERIKKALKQVDQPGASASPK